MASARSEPRTPHRRRRGLKNQCSLERNHHVDELDSVLLFKIIELGYPGDVARCDRYSRLRTSSQGKFGNIDTI